MHLNIEDNKKEQIMDLNVLKEARSEVLAELEKEFVDELVPARLVKHEGTDIDVLNVLLEDGVVDGMDARGEFFFLESSEEDEIQFFVNIFTIAEEITDEKLAELAMAISVINAYLPVGTFALDFTEKSLVFKHTYEMGTEIDKAVLKDGVDLSMSVAFQTVSDFGYLLIEVLEGRRDPISVISTFLPPDKE